MVEELYAEELAAFVQALGDAAVFGARGGVAAGVVMHDDDGGRTRDYGVLKDLAGMHQATVEDADRDNTRFHHSVFCIHQE